MINWSIKRRAILLDRQPKYFTLQNDINKLSAEILRLAKLPYRSKMAMEKIRKVDDQIKYLEELLAAFERDQKGKFE